MTDRIGIIGDPDSILAFKAIGVETFGASSGMQAKDLIKEMSHKNFKVIFITEKLAEEIDDFLKKYKSETYPCIIPVPSGEASGYGMDGIRSDMEKAIGADILFRKD
ncbi:MAG: V-type ATP synthase subunit F [Clostridia bacterium]